MKNKQIYTFTIIFLLIFYSCNASVKKITIYIQPFNDCPKQKIEQLKNDLEKVVGNVVVNKSIALPDFTLNDAKTRYRADKLIKFSAEKNA